MNKLQWQSAEYFNQVYAAQPIPPRTELSLAQNHQCQSIGWTLIHWLQKYGPPMLQEREVLRESFDVESNPMIVFITSTPGLVAAAHLLKSRPPHIVYFSRESFDSFLEQYPDPNFRWHVVFTSLYTEDIAADTLARASAAYPLGLYERYWLHLETSELADLFALGAEHLWRWDGIEPLLLEEAFNTWRS